MPLNTAFYLHSNMGVQTAVDYCKCVSLTKRPPAFNAFSRSFLTTIIDDLVYRFCVYFPAIQPTFRILTAYNPTVSENISMIFFFKNLAIS